MGYPSPEVFNILSISSTFAETCLTLLQSQYYYNDDGTRIREMNSCRFLIEAIESLRAPWRRLPLELLREIFLYCIPAKWDPTCRAEKRPTELTRVCYSWNRIALGIPQLWTHIALLFKEPPSYARLGDRLRTGVELLHLCILRSRNFPLMIALDAQFINYRSCYELLQQHSYQIVKFDLFYPPRAPGYLSEAYYHDAEVTYQWFPTSFDEFKLTMPNLRQLGIHDPHETCPLQDTDVYHLRHLADSALRLETYVFDNELPHPLGPIPTNFSNLTYIELKHPITLTLLSHIFQNAQRLQQAWLHFVDEVRFTPVEANLQAILSSPVLTSPFIHNHLETLVITYNTEESEDFGSLFDLVTLPRLRRLALQSHCHVWAQEQFVSFLRRSKCPLKALNLLFTPVTAPQLIEIIEVPTLRETLRQLMIENWLFKTVDLVDDTFCRLFTLPRTMSAGNSRLDRSGVEETTDDNRILVPNLEILGLRSCFSRSWSVGALVNMLKSRLDPAFEDSEDDEDENLDTCDPYKRKYLKYFLTDIPGPLAEQYLWPLCLDGLVTFMFETATSCFRGVSDEDLWIKYHRMGLESWVTDFLAI